jgi:hypothetical protein
MPLRGTTLYKKGAVSRSDPSDPSDGSDISDQSAKDEQAIFKGGTILYRSRHGCLSQARALRHEGHKMVPVRI